ncbi:Phosphoenolpyruvate carboxylase family protein [Thalictrum thalictroides]|uniref:Phosphoenolpyruvate carboxylase family protein n=1 Tax=Thalictrum thalictroides TaxID=46969 RepID=A0A7J6WFN4_THATH|nr:Phosphoenolpyruvate carboxylase family protein [Thalictrum thalictroides]
MKLQFSAMFLYFLNLVGLTTNPTKKIIITITSFSNITTSSTFQPGPACFDALSAKLVEKTGFEFCFTSGFSISAARLGLPDVGLISFGEMLDQGRQITQAVSIPVIGDGDNEYGNACQEDC